MTPEEFLISIIEDSLPEYIDKIHTGNGRDFANFLESEATEKPSAFISYEGFSEDNVNENGSGTDDIERYNIYLRTDDNVKDNVKSLKAELLSNYSVFEDADGNEHYVRMESGQAYRDNGSDAFQISVTIQ